MGPFLNHVPILCNEIKALSSRHTRTISGWKAYTSGAFTKWKVLPFLKFPGFQSLHAACFSTRTYQTEGISAPNGLENKHRGDIINSQKTSEGSSTLADIITQHTVTTVDHLTPEISLRLITRECPLWHQTTDQCPFIDPFWAFYWPGGQALTRFLLDHPTVVRGKSVLDVGSGCGASAIAAVMGGATRVLANDIDSVAIEAIKLNAAMNGIALDTSTENLIGQTEIHNSQWDVVFLGDMFYDGDFTNTVADWLTHLRNRYNNQVLIGDPGRIYLRNHPMRDSLKKLFEIDLPPGCIEENRGHSTGYVREFVP